MFVDSVTLIVCAVLLVLAVLSVLFDTFFRKLSAGGLGGGGCDKRPVSVIVVADNNARELGSNLPAFLSQDYPEGYEVIVVVVKDEDGTGDVLKAFKGVPNLYTTFVPETSRYMSVRKLAVTLGVKAAKNEWVLLTDATCYPVSDKWIDCMSSYCGGNVNMVIGYGNYSDETGFFKMFCRFHREYALLQEACSGMAYGTAGNNLMFRKSMFMTGNGFQGNLKYLRGEYDFLVNKYAGQGNVAVALSHDGYIVEKAPSRKEWHNRNLFYVETRRHLSRSLKHRLRFNLDMFFLYSCLLCGMGVAVFAAIAAYWTVLVISCVSVVAPLLQRTFNAKRAMSAFLPGMPLWKVVPFELCLVWHNLRYAFAYVFSNKYDFISHKS